MAESRSFCAVLHESAKSVPEADQFHIMTLAGLTHAANRRVETGAVAAGRQNSDILRRDPAPVVSRSGSLSINHRIDLARAIRSRHSMCIVTLLHTHGRRHTIEFTFTSCTVRFWISH